jgi:uncharacterized membrane protein YccC
MRWRHGVVLTVLSTVAMSAQAYIGPGAGIGLVGSLLGWVVGIALALFAILAWPVRLLWRRLRRGASRSVPASSPDAEPPR